MEIIGKLIKKLPEQSGESSRGFWVKMEFVIETLDQFPKQVCFSLWGEDNVAIVRNMQLGTETKVYFSPESKEFKERWYTDLKCFRLDILGAVNQSTQQIPTQQSQTTYQPKQEPEVYHTPQCEEPQEDDDLPF